MSTCELEKELVEELKQKDCTIEVIEKTISVYSLMKIIKTAVD